MHYLKRNYKEAGLSLGVGVSGEYSFYKRKLDGRIEPCGSVKNIILAGGVARLNTANKPNRMSVGTGTAQEDFNQTSLGAELLSTTNRISNVWGYGAEPDYHSWGREIYQFDAQPTAYTITEVGFGPADDLFSRSLIRDMNGTPTSISVLAGEFLYVHYTLRRFHNQPPVEGILNINGVGHSYTMVPGGLSVGSYTIENMFPIIRPWMYGDVSARSQSIRLCSSLTMPSTPLDAIPPGSGQDIADLDRSWTVTHSGNTIVNNWSARSAAGKAVLGNYLTSGLLGIGGFTATERGIAIQFHDPIELTIYDSIYTSWEATCVTI